MDEDPRFPNRKKRKDWDMSALDKPAEAPGGEQTEDQELPINAYRVMDAAPKSKEEEQREREELYAFRQSIPETQRAKVEQPVHTPIAEASTVQMPDRRTPERPSQGWRAGILKFVESQTRVYAAIGIGLGILLGAIIASLTWFTNSTPNGRYDLGPVDSSAAGLKGRLYVEWNKTLNYRVSIEPDDPARQAAFALAVAKSPHPLSIEIHLQDSGGFALCSKEILLRYDARGAAELAEPAPEEQDDKNIKNVKDQKTNAQAASSPQPAPAIDYSQADAQEAARENGKDIFKNQIGSDGQITAISAQGATSCTAKAYEKVQSWSFTPNFPSIAEQDALLERQKAITADAGRTPAEIVAIHKKRVAKVEQKKVVGFSIEGDDSIVDFDASRGVIETRSGKVFFLEKGGGSASDPRWQDYPVEIHYRCAAGSECILMHHGAGALRARLRR